MGAVKPDYGDLDPQPGLHINVRSEFDYLPVASRAGYLEDLMSRRFKPVNAGEITKYKQRAKYLAGNVRYHQQMSSPATQALFAIPGSERKMTEGELATLRAKEAARATEEKVKAQGAASTRDRATQRAQSRISVRGIAIGNFAEANYYAMVLGQTIFEHGRAVERHEKRVGVLGVGRRGALATRPFQPIGSTNRTGAAAGGRSVASSPLTSAPAIVSPRAGAAAKSGSRQLSADKAAVGESQRSKDARALMASSPSMPSASAGTTTRSRSSSSTSSIFARLVSPMFNSLAGGISRAAAKAGTSPMSLRPRTGAPALLTSVNAMGVASASGALPPTRRKGCDCAPKKRAPSTPKCRNPVISRTTKDGIRTTKTRITCPPSRPNSR